MPDKAREGESERAIGSVRQWRTEALIEAGYPQEEAFLLAGRLDIDLHKACDLLAAGCPLPLAIRILT